MLRKTKQNPLWNFQEMFFTDLRMTSFGLTIINADFQLFHNFEIQISIILSIFLGFGFLVFLFRMMICCLIIPAGFFVTFLGAVWLILSVICLSVLFVGKWKSACISGSVALIFAVAFKYTFRWHIDRMSLAGT